MTGIPSELRARLVHDVGKHVARTARNVRGTEVPRALLPLLLDDLYRIDGARRASLVFAELCGSLADARLSRVTELFAAIDTLEGAARRADEAALRRVIALALEVESELRALVSSEERG